MNTALKILDH